MNTFINLSLPKRLTAVLLALALAVCLMFALVRSTEAKLEASTNTPVGASGTQSPSPSSLEPTNPASPAPTATYDPNDPTIADKPAEGAMSELTPEDYATAQTVTEDGISNFYKVYSAETPEQRLGRLAPYFPADSKYLSTLPDGGTLNPQNEDSKIDMSGEITVDEPLFARDGVYSALITLTTGVQFTYTDSSERPQVVYGDETITVTTEKVGSSWLITNIEVQR